MIQPAKVVKKAEGHYFVDFGKAAFGTVELTLTSPEAGRKVEVHLGEVPAGSDAIDRNPGGSRRYRMMTLTLDEGTRTYRVTIPPDKRNTGPQAVKMPDSTGEVMPFRYCEIVNSPCEIDASSIRQIAVHYPFDDEASRFVSSDPVLNDVWELCKYSIKATSFCGVYVDGDRERIPYEADAYINQLCHYGVDREYTMARYTHEYLITHATWPTEWILHSRAHGLGRLPVHGRHRIDRAFLRRPQGQDPAGPGPRGRPDQHADRAGHRGGARIDPSQRQPARHRGLAPRQHPRPPGRLRRNGRFRVPAHQHGRERVSLSGPGPDEPHGGRVGKTDDAARFARRPTKVRQSFNDKLLDKTKGIYIDGEGSSHSALHANMFPLAFGLVPQEYVRSVADFVKSRGMVCSVYGSQYLLEALYEAGEDDFALQLMTDRSSDRSWPHMIYDVGTTITLEAWDNKYKPNQDWNHAWGAAPANIIPRYLMGVQPTRAGLRESEDQTPGRQPQDRQPGPAHGPRHDSRGFHVGAGPVVRPEHRAAGQHRSGGLPAPPGKRQSPRAGRWSRSSPGLWRASSS